MARYERELKFASTTKVRYYKPEELIPAAWRHGWSFFFFFREIGN